MEIERIESLKPKIVVPTSLNDLEGSILAEDHVAPQIRLCPGMIVEAENRRELIFGRYGLELLDDKTGRAIAKSGFNVGEEALFISHTPQGIRYNLSAAERSRLVRSDFRHVLMDQMIALAQNLGVDHVFGQGAAGHRKVIIGQLTYEQAYSKMDALFLAYGFEPRGNFYTLPLH